MKAVIMCGGKGTRLRPLTERVPKPMVKIVNRPVIDIIIDNLIKYGITDINISLGYKADDIVEFCESKNYSADIRYFYEKEPLGTAGGVKNSLNSSDDDFLVLSGDNIFNINLNNLFDFHKNTDADATICAVEVADPREYGIVLSDNDMNIINFFEKPTWETAETHTVNTGIYLFKGKILELIPNGIFFDFSRNLFPLLLKNKYILKCYKTNEFWGDMGEISSMISITSELLSDNKDTFNYSGAYFGKDVCFENGAIIKAPVLIGKKTVLGDNSVVGPFSVIGENCTVGSDSVLKKVMIGDNCKIGADCELRETVIDDEVVVEDNCFSDSFSVIGYRSRLGRFSRLQKNIKIFPGVNIYDGSYVNKDVHNEFGNEKEFNVFGISKSLTDGFAVSEATELGAAIASVDSLNKIGIGSDSKLVSENYKNALICGLRSAGKIVYDFGEIFSSQVHFFSAYCSLDFFIFIYENENIIQLSFYGKYSMPISSLLAGSINNNLRFHSYKQCKPESYSEIYNMKLFSVVYKSYFKTLAGNFSENISLNIESDNVLIKDMLMQIIGKKECERPVNKLTVIFKENGKDMYIIEDERYYSSDNILVFLCQLELAEGKNIIIPEQSADFIEENSGEFIGKVLRVYENSNTEFDYDSKLILENSWTFDSVLMLAKLLDILNTSGQKIKDLLEFQPEFAINKCEVEIGDRSKNLSEIFKSSGGIKKDDIYYYYENRKGSVRMRQMGNSKKIRLLARSFDIENAKELTDLMIEKLKCSIIDKED